MAPPTIWASCAGLKERRGRRLPVGLFFLVGCLGPSSRPTKVFMVVSPMRSLASIATAHAVLCRTREGPSVSYAALPRHPGGRPLGAVCPLGEGKTYASRQDCGFGLCS